MISMIDDAVGQVRESAGDTPAVTIFTSDHGDHLGDHKMLFKGAAPYEEITHVPFIWADPDAPGGDTRDDIAQTHDIGTTILERASVEPALGMQGRSFLETGRKAAFIQYDHQADSPGLKLPPRAHTIRQDDWRLTLYHGEDWGELYDLDRDPGEFENLWADPAHAGTRAELIEALLRLEIASVDRAPAPTGYA
jgi:arylsulfatase A-like enzyme